MTNAATHEVAGPVHPVIHFGYTSEVVVGGLIIDTRHAVRPLNEARDDIGTYYYSTTKIRRDTKKN